jgi:hypothetical protein
MKLVGMQQQGLPWAKDCSFPSPWEVVCAPFHNHEDDVSTLCTMIQGLVYLEAWRITCEDIVSSMAFLVCYAQPWTQFLAPPCTPVMLHKDEMLFRDLVTCSNMLRVKV